MKKNFWLLLALLVAISLVLAACGGAEAPAPAEEPAAEEPAAEEPAAEEPAAEEPAMEEEMAEMALLAPAGGFLEQALAGDFAGTVVTVDGPFVDTDEVKFNNSMAAFEEATGIDVQYQGSKEFEAAISVRVDGGDAPDIADFPQPGLLASFVQSGDIVDVSTFIDDAWLKQQYNQSWLDMATIEGPDGPIMAGTWGRYFGKSIVYYPKQAFEASGYEIPQTWDEMMELTQMIADDGDAAWCIGIESGAATGWAATDWTEELMLRTTSLENYDAWTVGDLPFESPEVKGAIETWSQIWLNDEYVYGGTDSIVTTSFGDAPTPMFDDPPKCWLHKQGNFIVSFFPEGVEYGTDYGIFYLPPVDEAYGKPLLISGDLFAMFNDRPEVRAAMEYFTTSASMSGYITVGGGLSPHTDANVADYGNDLERDIAALATEATSFRFDGSDLMPGEVGAGSFWKGMTDYVSGSADIDTVLTEIDASWPAGVEGQSSAGVGEEDEAAMAEGALLAPAGGFLEQAMAGDFAGTVVTVDGPFVDTDEVKFNESMKAFEEATGIDVQYQGSKEFEAAISVRVDGGDAPDIADFPQPGLLASFVQSGDIVDVSTFIDDAWLKQQYNQSWLDMATIEGPDGPIMAGTWGRYFGKSIVYYPKQAFEASGYEIPQTWDEMMELTQMIADDGDAAWCIGIESGAATGWAATDWTEELMLRTTSLENYDAWTVGDLPFESPEVKGAIETWSQIWLNDEYVYGGTDSIVTTSFGDAPTPMFDDPPKCWLHKQGNFIVSFFPEGVEYGTDYGIFYLPPVDEAYGKPLLISGDLFAMFNDRPEVRAAMEYFTTSASMSGYITVGGGLSPHTDANVADYGNDLERDIAALATEATSFRFDGSDLMPGEVGAGSFWKGMTDYVSGAADLDTVLGEIDASWPQ